MRNLRAEALAVLKRVGIREIVDFCPVGSSIVEGVEAKDFDILVLCGDWQAQARQLQCFDWVPQGKEYNDNTWGSYKKDNVNLLLCSDSRFYDDFILAARVCAALKLWNRGDRVLVHKLIRDGEAIHLFTGEDY